MIDVKKIKTGDLGYVTRVVLDMRKARSDGPVSLSGMIRAAANSVGQSQRKYHRLVTKPKRSHHLDEREVLEKAIVQSLKACPAIGEFWRLIEREAVRRRVKNDVEGADEQAPSWVTSREEMPEDFIDDVYDEAETRTQYPHSTPLERNDVVAMAKALLGLEAAATSQKRLEDVAGHYLIVRYLFSADRYVVSHMVIDPPTGADVPATFVTRGGEDQRKYGFHRVSGVAFALENLDEFMTIGKSKDKLNVRAAILSIVSDSELPGVGSDLQGIRVSTGTKLNDQVGHRLWCRRLHRTGSERDDNALAYKVAPLVGTFTKRTLDERVGPVIGEDYGAILDWLRAMPTMSIEQYSLSDRNLARRLSGKPPWR